MKKIYLILVIIRRKCIAGESAYTMSMKKEYPADVICQFTHSGKILPIRFRIREDGGQETAAYHEFNILSYQEKYRHLEYRQGFMTDYQIISEIEYCCRICDDGREKNVYLKYYIAEMRWTVQENGS